jgi:hypothetical protein
MSRLGAFLVQEGILSASDKQMIRRESMSHHGSFARSILALGLLDEDELSALFASKTCFRQSAKDIMMEIDAAALDIVPAHILSWLEALPLSVNDGTLTVAVVDPTDDEVLRQLAFFSGLRVKPVIGLRSEILRGLKENGIPIHAVQGGFESFLKTHSRMATQVHRKKSGARRAQTADTEFDSSSMISPSMIIEDDGVFAPPPTSRIDAGMDQDFDADVPSPGPAAQQRQEVTLQTAGVNLDDAALAATASDDLVDDSNMNLAVEIPSDIEMGEASGVDSAPPVPLEAALPDALEQESLDAAAPQAAKSGLGDIDLSGLDSDLDFDLDDEGNEIPRPKKSAAPTAAASVAADDSLDLDGALADTSPADAGLAGSASDDMNMELDMDIDLDVDLGGDQMSPGLPGGLDDEVAVKVDSGLDDPADDILAGADDDNGPVLEADEGGGLTLGADDLSLGSDDLSLGGLELEEAVTELSPDAAAVEALTLPDEALPMTADDVLAETSEATAEAMPDSPGIDLAGIQSEPDMDIGDLDLGSLELPDGGVMDKSIDLESDDGTAQRDGSELSMESGLSEEGDPAFEIPESASLDASPDVDVSAARNLESPGVDDVSGGDSLEAGLPGFDGAVEIADVPQSAEASDAGQLQGAAHPGVSHLNRALVQLQLTSDLKKSLTRVADVAAKVKINGGAIMGLVAGKVIPGVMWQVSDGKVGSIPDLPGGCDAAMMNVIPLAATESDEWLPAEAALGNKWQAFKNGWPDADSLPNFVTVKANGDQKVVCFAQFDGESDHDGIKQALGDVVRATLPKFKA